MPAHLIARWFDVVIAVLYWMVGNMDAARWTNVGLGVFCVAGPILAKVAADEAARQPSALRAKALREEMGLGIGIAVGVAAVWPLWCFVLALVACLTPFAAIIGTMYVSCTRYAKHRIRRLEPVVSEPALTRAHVELVRISNTNRTHDEL